jgi:hypothetical protein
LYYPVKERKMILYRLLPLVYLLGLFEYASTAENKLSGKVVDISGAPIEGAEITLLSTDQTVTSLNDGTFGFEISSIRRSTKPIQNHIKINNGKLLLHITDLQEVLMDLFNLNGRKICVLQNGKLNPGFYQFIIPEKIGNQIFLLRTRIGPTNQVYKLPGNSNVSFLKEYCRPADKSVSTNVSVADTLIATHVKYDDVTVAISSYLQPITVQMPHNKLSFELLNAIKPGDTLFNSSNRLMISLDSVNDIRCPCNMVCDRPDPVCLYLMFHVDTISYPLQFRFPIRNDTTVAGYKLVLAKVDPACPPNDKDPQNYSISFGITRADSFRKIVFLNYTRHERFQFEHDSCVNFPCLPLVTFNFSEDRILSGTIPEINDSTKLIFGDGLYVNFNGTDIGAQNFLTSSESLQWQNKSDFSVDSIGSDGTVWIRWKNENLTLKPGNRKVTTEERIDSSGPCIINVNTIDTLTNYGILYPWQIQRND